MAAKSSNKATSAKSASKPTKKANKDQEVTTSQAGAAMQTSTPQAKPVAPSTIMQTPPDEVVLTDAEGRRYCRSTDCDQIGIVDGYCRFHYLFFWKKIQVRKKILADGKLERYIDELTARYTDKFIEILRKDLRTEKDFLAAVAELELDDSANANAQDEDEAKTYIEEISGVQSDTGRDDEGYG